MAQPTLAELRAYAESGQIPLDSGVRAKLLSEHGVASKAAADYRKTKDAGMLKYRIAQLENSQRMLTANQRASNALLETKGKSARAAAQALQERMTGLDNNLTQIATRTQQFSSRVFNPVQAAYDASGKTEEAKHAALLQLTREMGNQGVAYDSGAPEIAALGQQFLTMTGEGSLADLSTPEARAAASVKMGASPKQQEDARAFLDKAYAAFDQERVARGSIEKGKSELGRIVSTAVATDKPVSQELSDQIAKLNRELDTSFASYTKESMPEVQAQLQAAIAEDSEYQRLLGEADWYKSEYERLDPAMRKSKEVSLGRIVAQPIFQEWAKSNGLDIGTARVNADGTVTYAPGGDDFKALMRFQYQMQHPDRFGERLFFDRGGSTGTVVEVSYTDPAERERQLARLAYDNGNLVGVESDGKMRYLTKQQYEGANENNGAEPTGYRHAKVGDKLYVKDPIGNISEVNPDGTTKYIGDTLAGAEFGDAVIYKDGKPARYMTMSDFNSPETLAVDGSLGVADPAESAELAKVSPFKRVPPDQAREIGTFTTIGTLDKMHANTIIKNGVGALSINGGQQIITPAMKPYVREIVHKDGTKLSDAGGVVRQVYAENVAREYGASDPRVAENRAVAGAVYGSAPEGGTTTAPLGTAATASTTVSRAGDMIPQPNALLQSALASPNPQAQTEQLERSTLVPPGTSAQVAGMFAQQPAAPAAATAPASAPAAPSAAGTAPSATAPVAAAAPAAAPTKQRIQSNGYTYEVEIKDGQATYTVVGVPPGVNMPQDRVLEPSDKRYAAFDENLRTEAETAAKAKAAAPAAPAPAAPAPAAAAPAARPAPPKVEGRGEGAELEVRRGVLTEPTTRTRPTLASTIVGGLRGALRTDAEGKEEPGLIGALKARREAKREEERAKMQGEARAEAERQGERFERAYDQSPRGRAEAAKSADDAVSKAVAAGGMTASEASAARAKLGLKTPAAPAAATAPATAPAAPATAPDMEAFLPRKSMAAQVTPQGIGKPTQEPAAPVRPSMAQPSQVADTVGVVRAPSGARAAAQPPLGKAPLRASAPLATKAEPAAPSTEGAFKPGPQVEADMKRPSKPLLANAQAETAARKGQAEADKAKAEKAGTLKAYRSLSEDFRPMHSVGMSRDEAMQYERDKQTYSNRLK